MLKRFLSAALLVAALAAPSARAADKVTLDGLLKQMTDLSQLAEYPDPPYIARQFSSYDRASEAPGNDAWFANSDRGFLFYDGVVKDETPYFKTGPMQMSGPDGKFAAGTKVGFAPTHKPIGDYVWAYAAGPDGRPIDGKTAQGYIAKSAITMDPQGHVLAEMDGPGCVTRIWSANPADAGDIRIYLDEAKEPVIEAPLADLLGGKWKTKIDGKETTPFTDPIACERSRGFNLYFPIAYAKHCKIVVEKPDIYYHVDYRIYPKGTEVETFSLGMLSELANRISTTAENLRRGSPNPDAVAADFQVEDPAKLPKGVNFNTWLIGKLEPGKSQKSRLSQRDRAETMLDVQISPVKDPAKALRGLVLRAWFDEADQPQIVCPLGDFFASSPGLNPSQALPVRISENKGTLRLTAYWWMPHEKSGVYEIQNLGEEPVTIKINHRDEPYTWTDRSMHFHAKWRTADMKTRPFHDWTYCDLKGKGVFVGDMLSVMNPVGAWWGEGDEKIFVDGEKFPSWFGTGSEDYYGYAWSDPTPFQHAYHNQTRCDGKGTGATFGLTSVNRFHILDAIPFEKSFRFDMEVWHWDPNVTVNYAATSYWYARPDATDDFEPVEAKVLQNIPGPPPPSKIEGALEGEQLKVLDKSSDFPLSPQSLREFGGKWSGDAHLWARPPKAGEWADLEIPVAADGKYEVVVYLTKARDYGIVQFQLDGKDLGKAIDGFESDKVVATGPIVLGTAELKKGTAKLRVTVTGSNEKAVGLKTMWGLDCVVLKPAGK